MQCDRLLRMKKTILKISSLDLLIRIQTKIEEKDKIKNTR